MRRLRWSAATFPIGLLACVFAAHPLAAQAADGPVGVYALPSGHLLAVATLPVGGREMLLVAETENDQLRLLFPAAGDTFFTGRTVADPSQREARVVFLRDAEAVTALRIEPVAGSARTAPRVALERRPFTVRRPDVTLEGELLLPAQRAGALPLIALAHGSEESDRRSFGPIPLVLAARGFAVVVYDKRGTGGSSGSWQDAGIEELAEDLAAVIAHAGAAPGIDTARIGIVGVSEGAWVAPRAARAVSNVRTIVALSGGGLTKGHAYVHKNRLLALEAGLSGASLDSALAAARATIEESLGRVRSGAEATGFDRRVSFDPTADWSAFTGSVLYLGGEFDVLESAPEAADWLADVFARAGNPHYEAYVFPRAHHSLLLGETGTPTEFRTLAGVRQLVPGYWDILLRWLGRELRPAWPTRPS